MRDFKSFTVKIAKLAVAVTAAAFLFMGASSVSLAYTETEGKVVVDGAKIRESSNTGSTIKATLDKGSQVIIVDEESDSAGTLWYKVKKGDTVGYMRNDLLEKGNPVATETTDDSAAAVEETAETADGVTAMAQQYASVTVNSGKMRSDASTKASIVTTLDMGAQLIVSGQKSAADGVWYYVSTEDGSSTGYMRNDLVALGDLVTPEIADEPVAEEPAQEEVAAPVEESHNDYEVVYTADSEGVECYYLYDHVNGNRMKLEDLLKYADSQANKSVGSADTAKKLKVVCAILAVLLLIAIVALLIFGLKLRDAYYEEYGDDDDDYEDEDDDDDEYYEALSRKPAPAKAPASHAPVSQRPAAQKPVQKAPARQTAGEYGTADEGVRRTAKPQPKPQPKPQVRQAEVTYDESQDIRVEGAVKKPGLKKSKNFLIDDDDFEFEFLNMDDEQ